MTLSAASLVKERWILAAFAAIGETPLPVVVDAIGAYLSNKEITEFAEKLKMQAEQRAAVTPA